MAKIDGASLGYAYHLPSGGCLLRLRNALSQFSDLFSEFNKYIAPAYHHDRCERSSIQDTCVVQATILEQRSWSVRRIAGSIPMPDIRNFCGLVYTYERSQWSMVGSMPN
ncbi:hypothetical protein J6590_025866 [Homalodisca vitripennis]|nr:hypothetical protein J6590_025866 [Homalodisca vitripennis]